MIETTDFGDWKQIKKLGDGGFGEVRLWQHRISGQELATKRCLRDRKQMHDDEIEKLKSRWKSEYQWMLNVNTQYIVRGIQIDDQRFIQHLNEQHYAWPELPVITMEYCNGGDLRSVLRKHENCNGLSEFEVRQVMHALRHAIDYLHTECKIEHRDLKPDNIVIHCVGSSKIYKLTDFGFCREVRDKTAVASIVGTQNYIAPEIVDTSQYTKTVDYWSMGIIAFELMCGVTPFIPHQKLFNKIINIKKKPSNCIAIQEDPIENEKFQFIYSIYRENHLSRHFQLKMENWLRKALDKDHRGRGKEKDELQRPIGELKIFTELDDILQSKILTVFCLNTYQFYSFEVDHRKPMVKFVDELESETGLSCTTFYLILPTGHPHRQLTQSSRPIDLYVEDWINNASDSGNPPVMLYMLSYQGDYNASDPYISNLIKLLLERPNLSPWTQPYIVAHTHFLLGKEQRHLELLLRGLHEYALTIDNEIFHFEGQLEQMKEQILILDGRVRQFHTMVEQAKIACQSWNSDFFKTWEVELEKIISNFRGIQGAVGQTLLKRYKSTKRRINEQAMNNYFVDTTQKDIYGLCKFRKWQQKQTDIATKCKEYIYNCLHQRNKFLSSPGLSSVRQSISDIHEEFRKIQNIVKSTAEYVIKSEMELVKATGKFQIDLLEHTRQTQVTQQFSFLKMDGINGNSAGDCPSLDEILNLPPTADLVEENEQQLLYITNLLEDDLPMTINID